MNAPDIRKHIGPLTLLGGTMIASATCLLIGLNFTTAINASVINGIQPVFTVLLATLFLHDRLRLSQSCGVALELIGVAAGATIGVDDFRLDFVAFVVDCRDCFCIH